VSVFWPFDRRRAGYAASPIPLDLPSSRRRPDLRPAPSAFDAGGNCITVIPAKAGTYLAVDVRRADEDQNGFQLSLEWRGGEGVRPGSRLSPGWRGL